jgi:hypothetical protein
MPSRNTRWYLPVKYASSRSIHSVHRRNPAVDGAKLPTINNKEPTTTNGFDRFAT